MSDAAYADRPEDDQAHYPRSGTLREIQRLSSLGKTPWSFAIDPTGQWMLVTNEGSNSVAMFGVHAGKLSPTSESLSIPHPVTVAFYAH